MDDAPELAEQAEKIEQKLLNFIAAHLPNHPMAWSVVTAALLAAVARIYVAAEVPAEIGHRLFDQMIELYKRADRPKDPMDS